MDIKACCVSLRDYLIGRLTSGDAAQPTFPNTINSVIIYDEAVITGTYTVRIVGSFTPGAKFWSDRADITLYLDGVEIGEANQRMLQLSEWLCEVCAEWSWSQEKWRIPYNGRPRLTLMPRNEGGAQYVIALQCWAHSIIDARP